MGAPCRMRKSSPSGRSSASVVPTQASDCSYSRAPGSDGRWRFVEFGRPGTLHYRLLFIDGSGKEMSLWHNVPLRLGDPYLNFVCKTPRGSWAEFEVAEFEHCNPLKLRRRRGKPAHFSENLQWNLGILPQTWSDPRQYNADFGGLPYDNCPLEVIEIGSRSSHTGDVYLVKPLAAFAVVSNASKLSWKVLAVAREDPLSPKLKTLEDLKVHMPGVLEVVMDWFKNCRNHDGAEKCSVLGPDNQDCPPMQVNLVIGEAHQAWQAMVECKPPSDPWSVPLPRPLSASVYESLWKQYTQRESPSEMPLSNPRANPSVQYERAWAGSSPESCHPESTSNSDPSWSRSDSFVDSLSFKAIRASTKSLRIRWPTWVHGKQHRCADSPPTPDAKFSKPSPFDSKLSAHSLILTDTKAPPSPLVRRKSFELERFDPEIPQEAFSAVRCKTVGARFPSVIPSVLVHRNGDLSPVFSPKEPKSHLPPTNLTWKKNHGKPMMPKVTTTKSLMQRLQLQTGTEGSNMKLDGLHSSAVMTSGIPIGIPIDRYDDLSYFGLSRRNSL